MRLCTHADGFSCQRVSGLPTERARRPVISSATGCGHLIKSPSPQTPTDVHEAQKVAFRCLLALAVPPWARSGAAAGPPCRATAACGSTAMMGRAALWQYQGVGRAVTNTHPQTNANAAILCFERLPGRKCSARVGDSVLGTPVPIRLSREARARSAPGHPPPPRLGVVTAHVRADPYRRVPQHHDRALLRQRCCRAPAASLAVTLTRWPLRSVLPLSLIHI